MKKLRVENVDSVLNLYLLLSSKNLNVYETMVLQVPSCISTLRKEQIQGVSKTRYSYYFGPAEKTEQNK
jgi:hypothetical protein